MEKIFGATGAQDGVVRVSGKSYILFYGYGEENGNGYNWRERYDHKPTEAEIRETIRQHVNSLTQAKILTGYEYNGKQIQLTLEHQLNYLTALYLKEVPLTVSTVSNETIVIETEEDLVTFAKGAIVHVRTCVETGRQEKEGVDYAALLKDAE